MRLRILPHLDPRQMAVNRGFKSMWKIYLYQSLLATAVLVVVLSLLTVENAVVVASIGATAFMVFTVPRIMTARPKRIIGGHLIGLSCGSLCAMIPHPSTHLSIVVYSLSVGLSMFLMVVLDMQHPPASGTALGVAISGYSLSVVLAILTSIILLSLARHYLLRFLRDLT